MTRILARDVVAVAARQFLLTPDQLMGPARADYVCMARNLTCKVIRVLCPHASLPAIGELLGGRDHTTILSNVRRAELQIRTDPQVAAAYRRLIESCANAEAERLDGQIANAEQRLLELKAERAALAPIQTEFQGA